ncbi:MAG TPA: hypothetical protein VL970_04110 [Candidatus Acidoferrales bacterium]|nr:hypothetical protein [Candidatus Acidoferrales bacterium]
MKSWFLPSADSPMQQWMDFILFLLLICICLSALIVWLKLGKKRSGTRRRRRRHHRPLNPTLDQTGGLPPRRDPNLPPPGP